MKKVDLEIKRMLSLLESNLGNVKPLLSEQLDTEDKGGQTQGMSKEDTLTRVKETGCLTNKGVTKKTAIQTKFVRAENPIQNVAVGFTEVDMLAQVPSQTNL